MLKAISLLLNRGVVPRAWCGACAARRGRPWPPQQRPGARRHRRAAPDWRRRRRRSASSRRLRRRRRRRPSCRRWPSCRAWPLAQPPSARPQQRPPSPWPPWPPPWRRRRPSSRPPEPYGPPPRPASSPLARRGAPLRSASRHPRGHRPREARRGPPLCRNTSRSCPPPCPASPAPGPPCPRRCARCGRARARRCPPSRLHGALHVRGHTRP
mmetsp:Transcript_100541/g.288754  ORF Transcript_100541/g.288754 Transcript_100541/m.288754 type:complete len:212 (-) Transcript_100541:286-921(-)